MEKSKFRHLLGHSKSLIALGWTIVGLWITISFAIGIFLAVQAEDPTKIIFVLGGIIAGVGVGFMAGMPYVVLGQWIQVFISTEQNTVEILDEQKTTNRMLAATLGGIKADTAKMIDVLTERSGTL